MKGHEKTTQISPGITVTEYSLAAVTGEFPTILVVAITGAATAAGMVAAGFLSELGKDIYGKLRDYLAKLISEYEEGRRRRKSRAETCYWVLSVHIIGDYAGVPIVYYINLTNDTFSINIDMEEVRRVEHEISLLIEAKELHQGHFVGINLLRVGRGPCLRLFSKLPSESTIIDEFTTDLEQMEARTHVYIGRLFDDLGELNIARRHYLLAQSHLPQDCSLWISLGVIHARQKNIRRGKESLEGCGRHRQQT